MTDEEKRMPHPLTGTWTEFEAGDVPFVLPGGVALLKDARRPGFVVHRSLAEYASSPVFGNAHDRRLHLGLRPIPFAGKLVTWQLLQFPVIEATGSG